MRGERTDREPCPWRIVDDAGGAFAFGLVGGGVWNFVGGWRNAPKGQGAAQAFARMQARTPVLGGSFAVWGMLFSCFDCSFTYLRKKEDPWNAIMSGAATGGLLAARAGLKAAGKNALVGGVILAAIEGLQIVIARVMAPWLEKRELEKGKQIDMLEPPVDPLRPRMRRTEPLWQPSNSPLGGLGGAFGALGGGGGSGGGGGGSSSSSSGGALALPSAGSGSGSGGFDLDSMPQFDVNADQNKNWSRTDGDKPAASNPWYKIW